MIDTPRLGLPLLAAGQAQKHVTHNEALLLLDALAQLAVADRGRDAPPADPAEGGRWIVGAAPAGAWAGQAGAVAIRLDGGWTFRAPQEGWTAYVVAERAFVAWSAGEGWRLVTPAALDDLSRLGIGTAADADNPFAAKLDKALWTARPRAEGGGGSLRYTLNKEGSGDVLSLLFQSGYGGRAELGLVGDDDLVLKVSPDGDVWREALRVDRATGIVAQARLPRFKAYLSADQALPADAWTRVALDAVDLDEPGAFAAGQNRSVAPVAGVYLLGASLLAGAVAGPAARLRARLVAGGAPVRGSLGEATEAPVPGVTALRLQTLASLAAGEAVELQAAFRAAAGTLARGETTLWAHKVG
jgi:hypothetical protein